MRKPNSESIIVLNNYSFEEGQLNSVVLFGGEEYFDNLHPGQKIVFLSEDENNHNMKTAFVKELLKGNFKNIPQYIYSLEHDPSCRTKEGLISVMKNLYDNFNVEDDPIVTCIVFKLIN